MKEIAAEIETVSFYNGSPKSQKGIMEALYDRVHYMTSEHTKSTFMAYEVNFPKGKKIENDSEVFKKLLAEVESYHKTQNLDFQYLYIRTKKSSQRPVYQLFVIPQVGEDCFDIYDDVIAENWSKVLDVPNSQKLITYLPQNRKGTTPHWVTLNQSDVNYSFLLQACLEWVAQFAYQKPQTNTPIEFGFSALPSDFQIKNQTGNEKLFSRNLTFDEYRDSLFTEVMAEKV